MEALINRRVCSRASTCRLDMNDERNIQSIGSRQGVNATRRLRHRLCTQKISTGGRCERLVQRAWFKSKGEEDVKGKPIHNYRAHREVVLFLAQREMDSVFQRLLNMERYEEAREVAKQAEKLQEMAANDSNAKGEVQEMSDADLVVKLLQLRTQLKVAVDNEDYQEAAKIRDEITKIEQSVKDVNDNDQMSAPKYKLGQCVVHWRDGWSGVICGIDSGCKEDDEECIASLGKEPSEDWKDQPFYQILPDMKFWMKDAAKVGAMVCYVAEDELSAPEPPATWRTQHDDSIVSHPYIYMMFYGQDGAGDFVPTKMLRDRYRIERRDVYWNNQDPQDEDDEDEDDKDE